jgi:hypothetical protein
MNKGAVPHTYRMAQIETQVYTRLSTFDDLTDIVSDRIYPTRMSENGEVPCAVYTITGAEATLTTQGVSNVTKYTLDVEAYAITVDTCLNVLSAVKAAPHAWRDDNIKLIFIIF